jgi:(p)ppGpp synthase/HD superfamily hydrolase
MSSLNGGPPAVQRASEALDEAYHGVKTKAGKGPEHARRVASVLHEAGCGEPVEVAGLLHDVVEDTAWTVGDLEQRFGSTVGALVAAVTEDSSIRSYRKRKRKLREQIESAGPAAIDIALADKIASLRYALESGKRVPSRKLAHYEATVAGASGAAHPALAAEVAGLLGALGERVGAAA